MDTLSLLAFVFLAALVWCGAAAIVLRLFYALDRASDRRRARLRARRFAAARAAAHASPLYVR